MKLTATSTVKTTDKFHFFHYYSELWPSNEPHCLSQQVDDVKNQILVNFFKPSETYPPVPPVRDSNPESPLTFVRARLLASLAR